MKVSSIKKAVIPVAGKGTRLMPLTKAVPKELLPLGSRPVLEYVLDEAACADISEILFVISEDKIAIKSHFGSSYNGMSIEYAFQEEQKGLADAVYCGKDFVKSDSFALILGDSVILSDKTISPLQRVLKLHDKMEASGVILVQDTPENELFKYGIVKPKNDIGDEFEIDGLIEKPSVEKAPSTFSIAGRYTFTDEIFKLIEQTPKGANNEYQITDSIGLLLKNFGNVWCVALNDNERRIDIGTFDTYYEAFEIFKER